MKTLQIGWIARLFVAKWLALFLVLGGLEYRLYVKRAQEGRFKFNGQFPADKPMDYFWFGSQNIDNFLRSMFVSVPICVAFEVIIFWAFANGYGNLLPVDGHMAYIAAMVFFTGAFHETYFFFAHWAMHWKPFYSWCHTVHHNSINPSPWTSMSNHPLESALQFGPAFAYLLLPAVPFMAMHHLNFVAFSSVLGHFGFDRIEVGSEGSFESGAYAHYLHHKYFDVNYCDNGVMPWDQWFGSFHDGTKEGDRLMQERFANKNAKANAS